MLTTIQHVTDREAVGNRPDHWEAMQKQCRSHAEATKPCGRLADATGKVLGKCRISAGDRPERGALRTYVRQDAKSSVKMCISLLSSPITTRRFTSSQRVNSGVYFVSTRTSKKNDLEYIDIVM